ncbi:MAG: type II toxin-antitoxin system VapC family toxin [Verrucomicrobiae bacterium]|nr:type II toxin-antitoxin system VapC family toxin [Verrucomicrobiae bacterium]
MDILIDTHVLIWFAEKHSNLTPKVQRWLENADNKVFLSVASLWEMAIKVNISRLKLLVPFETMVEQLPQMGFELMPIELKHVTRFSSLPLHHSDSFDRMLVAQAMEEKLNLVSSDRSLSRYGIKVMW